MDGDWDRLADHIVAERVRSGLDLRGLAGRTGVSERTLGKVEAGQRVSRDTLAAIELVLDWSPGSCRTILAGGEPPRPARESRAPAGYPAGVEGDPFLEYVWDYTGPGASRRDRMLAVKAVLTDRELAAELTVEEDGLGRSA